MAEKAEEIGANFVLIVRGKQPYVRFYKRGTWESSRNCLLYWNEIRRRWDNSCELSFAGIEYGLKVTDRSYELIDLHKKERKTG